MALNCDQTCGGLTYSEWASESEAARSFLIYCAAVNLVPAPPEEEEEA